MEEKKNIVLIDWLSFTSKKDSPEEIIQILGLEDLTWQDTTGARGYRRRKYYDGISIHFDGRDDMGVWCEMSGQGCRVFESFSDVGWVSLCKLLTIGSYNLTRMDIAYDDHTGIFDVSQVMADTDNQEWVSKSDWWQTVRSIEGQSCYIGSPKSAVRIRIYDKAAERKIENEHWNRVELQLRDKRAAAFCAIAFMNENIGETFAGVLHNYLRFVDPMPGDSNRWRWPMKLYWQNLIQDVGRISIYIAPGVEYNAERCTNFVVNQAGNAIAACLEMYGQDELVKMISNRKVKPNPKYDHIVAEYRYQQEEQKREEQMRKVLTDAEDERILNMMRDARLKHLNLPF